MNLRQLASTLLAALLLPFSAMAADAPANPRPKIGSSIFEWTKLAVLPRANGQRRDVANNPTATLRVFESHITTLNVGAASHAPHQHAQEELIFVKEGTVESHINGATQVVGPGSILFFATNDMHAIRNVGDTPATYWVVNFESPATRNEVLRQANPKVRSSVYDYSKLEVRPSQVGEGRRVLDGSTVTLANLETHITAINAGQAPHAPHRHADEEIVLVREGTLEVTINDKVERAGPGSVIFISSNDMHGWRNVSDQRASYHVIRVVTAETPKPPAKQ